METEILQHHHLHHLRHQKDNFIYYALGFIILLPLIWQIYGSDEKISPHPFFDVEYELSWYFTLTAMRFKPILYLIVARLAMPRHYNLIYIFIGYEAIMFIDHILFYAQSNFIVYGKQIGMRFITSFILAPYIVWYHYKYEPHR